MSATLGYWVDSRRAGHGLAPTAVALATDFCFWDLGLHRMEINIRPENAPSLRVVEKLGFRDEGLRRATFTSTDTGPTTAVSPSPRTKFRTGCLNRGSPAAVLQAEPGKLVSPAPTHRRECGAGTRPSPTV
jgi:hypothetical protein